MSKRILVILGHPDKESFNGALASAYIEGAQKSGAEVRRINIGDLTFDPSLRKGYKADQVLEPDLENVQEQIKWAEHVVWVYPIWWSLFPAILKGLIDRIFIPGYAFKHHKGKLLWDRNLKGKTSRIISTMDNFMIVYFLLLSPGTNALWTTLKYVGFGRVRRTFIGHIRKKSQRRLEKHISKIKKLGEKNK